MDWAFVLLKLLLQKEIGVNKEALSQDSVCGVGDESSSSIAGHFFTSWTSQLPRKEPLSETQFIQIKLKGM